MDIIMENKKWIKKPRKNGMYYINFTYRNEYGVNTTYNKSLCTKNIQEARDYRDTIFLPIKKEIKQAEIMLDAIITLYPTLTKKLYNAGLKFKTNTKTSNRLDDCVNLWLEAISKKNGNYFLSIGTQNRYISVMNNFFKYNSKSIEISSITKLTISDYRDKRLENDKVTKKTMSLDLTALNNLFSFLKDKGLIVKNPVHGVKIKETRAEKNRNEQNRGVIPPTKEEFDTICYNFPKHGNYSKELFQDVALFLRYTGVRVSKALEVNVADFHYYNKDILNVHTFTVRMIE